MDKINIVLNKRYIESTSKLYCPDTEILTNFTSEFQDFLSELFMYLNSENNITDIQKSIHNLNSEIELYEEYLTENDEKTRYNIIHSFLEHIINSIMSEISNQIKQDSLKELNSTFLWNVTLYQKFSTIY